MSLALQNQIILGDCLEKMKELPNESIDLVIIDPPYGINFKSRNRNDNKLKQYDDDKLDFNLLFNELYRILKNNTHCYIFTSVKTLQHILPNICKFELKNLLVIKNRQGVGVWNQDNFINHYELVLYLSKGKRDLNELKILKTKNFGKDKRQKNEFYRTLPNLIDWIYPNEFNLKMVHPNQKAVDFFQLLIKISSNENDLILDCFAGSGTTAIACLNTNRNYICIEKDEKYFEIMKNRIKNHSVNHTLDSILIPSITVQQEGNV